MSSDRESSDGEDRRSLEAEATGGGGEGGGYYEKELATRTLQFQSKRFYLDVKLNRKGKFIKISQIGMDGRRSQIFLALSTAAEFGEHLLKFGEFYASLGPSLCAENIQGNAKLKTATIVKNNRRYYFDFKENSRGRFLRISQANNIGKHRSQIAIPAQGIVEFRDALTDLVDEFGVEDDRAGSELPKVLKAENKNFYFDVGQNNRGIYMRVSEVKMNSQASITIPEKLWASFRDVFEDYAEKIKTVEEQEDSKESGAGSNSSVK